MAEGLGPPSPSEERDDSTAPQRRSERAHIAILDATLERLSKVGYQRLSIEVIASEAGVGKATVYRWWPTKAILVIEAMRERSGIQAVAPTGYLRTDIRALVRYAIEVITTTPFGLALPQLVADCRDDERARVAMLDWLGPPRAGHRALLYSAAGAGDLPHDVDPDLILDLIAGVVLWRTLLGASPSEQLVDQLVTFIVDRHLPRRRVDDRLL